MRKAKIMLMAIAVLGVIGGALAFKSSQKAYGGLFFCETTFPFDVCYQGYTTTPNANVCTYGFLSLTTKPNSWPFNSTRTTLYCTVSATVYLQAGE